MALLAELADRCPTVQEPGEMLTAFSEGYMAYLRDLRHTHDENAHTLLGPVACGLMLHMPEACGLTLHMPQACGLMVHVQTGISVV